MKTIIRMIWLLLVLSLTLLACQAEQQQEPMQAPAPSVPEALAQEQDSVVLPAEAPTTQAPVEISVIAKRFSFSPDPIRVKKGDRVILKITSMDVEHGFAIPAFGINKPLPPGQEVVIEFTADKTGTFDVFCSVYCGTGHKGMKGKLVVE
ncbi:cytochrome c oxidase subunit II [Candidatus Woesearchaeota archaeon]|nr:cytochrome c oxidase subunit II [Candidatus Woesearchaeota archaeon]